MRGLTRSILNEDRHCRNVTLVRQRRSRGVRTAGCTAIDSAGSTPRSSTWRTAPPTCTSPRRASSRARRPSHAEFRDHIASRLHLVPRFRQKLRFVPFGQGRPVWVDDPHLNLDYHVRQTALPAPGLRGAAAQPGGADLLPAARPHASRSGSCGWSRASRATASRSSARATTRWSTASPASTSPPSSSTSSREPASPPASRRRWVAAARADRRCSCSATRCVERATSPREIVRGVRAGAARPAPGRCAAIGADAAR